MFIKDTPSTYSYLKKHDDKLDIILTGEKWFFNSFELKFNRIIEKNSEVISKSDNKYFKFLH